MKTRLPFLVCLALAIPAQAQDVSLASLEATHLELTSYTAAGTGNALVYEAQDADHAGTFELQMTADSLHLGVDHSQSLVHAAGATVYGTPETGSQWTTQSDLRGALRTTAARNNFHLAVTTVETLSVHLAGTCLAVQRSVASLVPKDSTKHAASQRAFPQASVSQALQATSCGTDTVTLQGDLVLVLWETDFTIAGTPYHTGASWQPTRTPTGDTEPTLAYQLDQAYITARNATLTLSRNQDTNRLTYYLHTATANSSGATIAATAGLIEGQRLEEPRTLHYDGRLHLELAPPSSHTFNLQVSGADARRDGHAIVPASTATNLIRPGDLLLVPGILATALTLAGLRRLRTLRDRRRVARGDSRPADTLTERGRTLHMIGAYRRATRVLQQSLQLRPHHAWTRLALARSHQHLALGRRAHHHAQHALEEADHAFHDAKGEGLNHTLIAEAAFIAACAACTLNRDSDALVWLELAYCHNSAVAAWVHNEPALARLRSHPTYRRLLRENIGLRDDPLAP